MFVNFSEVQSVHNQKVKKGMGWGATSQRKGCAHPEPLEFRMEQGWDGLLLTETKVQRAGRKVHVVEEVCWSWVIRNSHFPALCQKTPESQKSGPGTQVRSPVTPEESERR